MLKDDRQRKYKWDIAISLCKQDVDFAKKLIKALNPNLKVFFYEHRQEELIGKSGPEEFAKIFKEQSRVIVILSRNEWSNTYYTEIERNAIISRTSVRNEGYHFLMVIPMVQDEIPLWYPPTNIYASPFRFSIEKLARFIEFKVADEGGIVKELTVEERYQNFIDRIRLKKEIINLQHQEVAIQGAKDEIQKFMQCFNTKIDFLSKFMRNADYRHFHFGGLLQSHFFNGNYLLRCEFLTSYDFWLSIKTTQDAVVQFELFKIDKSEESNELLESEQRIFYYTPELQGWGEPWQYEHTTDSERQVSFRNRDNTQFYDLINILPTDFLIDSWFQKLLSKSIENIERYL